MKESKVKPAVAEVQELQLQIEELEERIAPSGFAVLPPGQGGINVQESVPAAARNGGINTAILASGGVINPNC